MSIFHEYIHNAQDFYKLGNNKNLIEADADLKVAKYCLYMRSKTNKEEYRQIAEVALERYIMNMLNNRRDQKRNIIC